MAKLAAKGTVLAYESPALTWNTIPGVQDFEVPLVGEKDSIDVTSHDSPNGFEEKVTGIARTGSIQIPIVWDGTNTHHAALLTRANADTLTNFKVTAKDTKVYTFSAYIKGITTSHPVNGALTASVTLEMTGSVTVT